MKLDEEGADLLRRMAAHFGDARRRVDVEVLVLAQPAGDAVRIFGGVAEVHRDEPCLGMSRDPALELRQDFGREARDGLAVLRPARVGFESSFAFVFVVDGQPEGPGITAVNGHRHVEPRPRLRTPGRGSGRPPRAARRRDPAAPGPAASRS